MNAKRFYLLIAAAVLALAIAIAIQTARQPQSGAGEGAKLLLPQLHEHVNDVTAITLTGADAKVIATLKRGGDGWSLSEKSGYPADVAKVRELLLKLDQATLIEPKTANPNRYAEIGVDDVKSEDAQGVRVDIVGLPQPASLIIGIYSAEGTGTFVRRNGETQSWLASGILTIAKRTSDWVRHDVADIAPARFKSVTLTAPDGKRVMVYKERADDAHFTLADVPNGREPGTAVTLNTIASTLSGLRADDVFPDKDVSRPERTSKAEYVTFDGVVVTATAWGGEGKSYAQFSAKLDPAVAGAQIDADQATAKADYAAAMLAANKRGGDDTSAAGAPAKTEVAAAPVPKPLAVSDPAKDRQDRLAAVNKEVDALNRTFAGWTFVVQAYRTGNMTKTMDSMLLPLPEKGTGANDASTPAAKAPAKPATK